MIPKVSYVKKIININNKLRTFILELYLRSIFYRRKHIKKDSYKWLKSFELIILNKHEGKIIFRDFQYILPKNKYELIPSHQKYLYAALISHYDIPKYYLLFWDSLIVFKEIFIENIYNRDIKIKEGDVILDIGASIGWYACKISKYVGNMGKIFAIEPDPKNFHFLNKNIELNNLENIIALNYGVYSFKGNLNFLCEGYGSHIKMFKDIKKYEKIIKVKANTVDNIVSELDLNKINVIKMDIEGAELEAIKGAKNTLRNFDMLKVIIAAYHKSSKGIESYKILVPFLEKNNFKISKKHLPFIVGQKEY